MNFLSGVCSYWRKASFTVEWVVTADANLENHLPDSGDFDKTFILFNLMYSCVHSWEDCCWVVLHVRDEGSLVINPTKMVKEGDRKAVE